MLSAVLSKHTVNASCARSVLTLSMLANPSRIARIPSGQLIQVAPLRLFIMPSTTHVTQEESPGSSAAMGLKALVDPMQAKATASRAVATPHRIAEKNTESPQRAPAAAFRSSDTGGFMKLSTLASTKSLSW